MSATASPNVMSVHHTSYSGNASSPSGVHSGSRSAATRLDDAINQLRSLKQNGAGKTTYQTHVSTPLKGPVLSPRSINSINSRAYPGNTGAGYVSQDQPPGSGIQSMSQRTVTMSSSSTNGSMKSPPPSISKKPTIPPQLRRQSNPGSPAGKPSPGGSTNSSTSSYIELNSHIKSPSFTSAVVFDAQGRCTCCPFGYHVDIDFVNFSQDARSPTTTYNKPISRPRLSFDSQSSHHNGTGVSNYSNLFIDDLDHGNVKPVSVEVSHSPSPHRSAVRTQSAVEQRTTSPITSATIEESYRSRPNGQLVRSDSNETIDSMMNYSNQIKTTRRTVTSTQLAETMATHLPDNGGSELTISPESVEQIKKHMALSLQRMQELEDQVKMIPMMQERISRLKIDKKTMAEQLSSRSGISCMRSVGVGDYDVDEEQTRIEKVIQTVVQEPVPKPTSNAAVGNYDVNIEYLTEAEAYHTVAEKVQRIREKEIQTWIQEGENALAARRAAMRSCGVGDGDVFAEPETVKVIEKEIKTVYIEADKPEQRNVGLMVKPTMRDVCIEFSQSEEKPSTRTCGVNVDVNDLMMEMQSQNEEMERTEYGEFQQAGALASGQKNAWQMQKHVIQRKFMEAMHRGTQKDLVAFITGLLRRSVRSVGTTVKPVTADFGMKTSSSGVRGHDVGVGDDTLDVTVKPFVMTRDNFCTVKPVTRTQPTWTDLILTCDSAMNTQSRTAEKAVNTPPLVAEKRANVSTTLELRPAYQYTIEKEVRDVCDTFTNTLQWPVSINTQARVRSTNTPTSSTPIKPNYKPELGASRSSTKDSSSILHIVIEPNFRTELQTVGYVNDKRIYQPLYKTEITTLCKPLIEGNSIKDQVKLPHHSCTKSFQKHRYSEDFSQPTQSDVTMQKDSKTAYMEIYTGRQDRNVQNQTATSRARESSRSPTTAGGNSSTYTTTKTVRTSGRSGGRGDGSAGSNGSRSSRSRSSSKSGDISKEYVDDLLSTTGSSGSESVKTTKVFHSGSVKPEHLVEQKTEISADGAVSEITHEVTKAPGILSEKTVRISKHQGPDGRISESLQSDSGSQQTKSKTTRSTVTRDEESVLGSNFQKHKEDMMKLLTGQQHSALSPITIDVTLPRGGSSSSSTSTSVATRIVGGSSGSRSSASPSKTLSPHGVVIEREGAAQRKYEEEMRRRSSSSGGSDGGSGSGTAISGSSSTRHVTSSSDNRGDFSEVIEEKESADGSRKEVIIEKTFSSSGGSNRFDSKFPDFSDYFARGSGPPPKGREERMMAYDGTSYTTTSSDDVERNKTEMSGNPLKARYNIDDLSSPGSRGNNSSISSVTTTTRSVQRSSNEQMEDDDITPRSPRSIMKKEPVPSGFNRTISFAEEAEVAEVVEEGAELGNVAEVDNFSDDEEESEVSFEEGTYDGRQGDVSYHCEVEKNEGEQSTMTKAKSQEEIDIDVELQAACSIVQQHLESGETAANSKMNSALSVIQQDWFKVASGQQANMTEVDGYMACFEDFSTELLEHIINMTDGNGNTVLHYAVSHCNFPIVRLLVESGVADVNLQNKAGYTPIMLAALAEVSTDNDRRTIKLLLSKGNVNLAASQSGSPSVQAGQTALMLAVSHGRLEMVELLLQSGSDVNLQDEDGSTALMCATEHGHIEIVKILLGHHDIDIALKDNDGSTALEIALENTQKEIGLLLHAKDLANRAGSTTSIKKRASRIPASSSSSRGPSKSSSTSRVVTTRRRY